MTAAKHNIVGSAEYISFPEFKLTDIPAKIDTGADTGAIHCTKIQEKTVDGVRTLQFSPFDHPELTFVADDYFMKSVRSSNGGSDKRYFITTTIAIKGAEYPIQLSLADRSEMTWPVLIGKKFLAENNFLVDVTQGPTVLLAEEDNS